MRKTCSTCRATKKPSDFYRKGSSGRQSKCKACQKKANASPEGRAYRASHYAKPEVRARRHEQDAAAAVKEPWRKHAYEIERLYGLGRTDYQAMLESQDHACAICKKAFGRKRAFVDHDHTTGLVRGLLCCRCNFMLGYAKDNVTTLQSAIHYLKRRG